MRTNNQDPAAIENLSTIEAHARHVQLSVWNKKHELFRGVVPQNPVELLEPGVALGLLGFKTVTDSNLGEMEDGDRRVLVAGIIDRASRIVRISPNFTAEEQRFTAAHELGHAVLHPGVTGLHRDRLVAGPSARKEKREYEADVFATCFLMPERLVRRRFAACFGVDSLPLGQDALACLRIPVNEADRRFRSLRNFSLAVASAINFAGTPFDSLARYFRVSPTAMAIRLEELELVTTKA